ncbi:hypothetical protein [Streptomyces sp. NRRL F-5123]|uniref:hypothetical protein n=1 Tax=Streptomyces sp. NRRL F-5123 TaxID=1463856 RepID=UPI0004E22916|nr:hypothetical protein [Streptomyces sp. NRRL F-5123]
MKNAEQCKQDMAAVQTAADNIRTAINDVTPFLVNTWVGSEADAWATDFRGRMARLTGILDECPGQERWMILKATNEQADSDAKYHGHA